MKINERKFSLKCFPNVSVVSSELESSGRTQKLLAKCLFSQLLNATCFLLPVLRLAELVNFYCIAWQLTSLRVDFLQTCGTWKLNPPRNFWIVSLPSTDFRELSNNHNLSNTLWPELNSRDNLETDTKNFIEIFCSLISIAPFMMVASPPLTPATMYVFSFELFVLWLTKHSQILAKSHSSS